MIRFLKKYLHIILVQRSSLLSYDGKWTKIIDSSNVPDVKLTSLALCPQVTWIRHRDVHVLTVGEYTYTTDERFTARHNRATDEWVLVIKYVQERDAGVYECQIPTATSKAYPVQLNIVGE